MERKLPSGWECNVKRCPNHDAVGSENSCRGGSWTSCLIVQGFIGDEHKLTLELGEIVLRGGKDAMAAFDLGRRFERALPKEKR